MTHLSHCSTVFNTWFSAESFSLILVTLSILLYRSSNKVQYCNNHYYNLIPRFIYISSAKICLSWNNVAITERISSKFDTEVLMHLRIIYKHIKLWVWALSGPRRGKILLAIKLLTSVLIIVNAKQTIQSHAEKTSKDSLQKR